MRHLIQYPCSDFTLSVDGTTPAIDAGGARFVSVQAVLTAPSLPTDFTVASGTGGGFDLNDTITEAAHGLETGWTVTVAIDGGSLPAPLAAATPYYVIKLTDNTFKLATSYANAIAGSAINLTTIGSDGQIVTFTAVANTGALSLEVSNDGANFAAVGSSSQNFTEATTTLMWELASPASLFYRINVNNTAGSGMVMDVIGVTKFESYK